MEEVNGRIEAEKVAEERAAAERTAENIPAAVSGGYTGNDPSPAVDVNEAEVNKAEVNKTKAHKTEVKKTEVNETEVNKSGSSGEDRITIAREEKTITEEKENMVPGEQITPEIEPDKGPEAADDEAEKERIRSEARRSAFVEEVVSWVKSFVIMFIFALFLTQFIIINAVIPSGSMEDTIMTHDRLIGSRFSYWFSEPQRGDIVIFHYPVDEHRIYIKRIIGLPGETVRIKDAKIYIDDSPEPLNEGYLKEKWVEKNTDFTFEVPEDSYFMLGDNRNWSEDARYWAQNAMEEGLADNWEEAVDYSFVRKKKILGKAIFTYYRKFRILQHGEWYE